MATSGVALNDSDDDISEAQSCISNEEDFSDDDDVDYLALEVVNYLPEDKASKLMSNLRAKERAIQDLLKRNQSLLEMCDKLDKENQSTTERCDELSKRAEAAETAAKSAPVVAPEPKKEESKGPKVDTSYFDKLEQRKEETIANLTAENQRLAMINRRCQEQVAQMDARMQELVKESKQLRKKFQENDRRPAPSSSNNASNSNEIDEEERLYQELQRNEQADLIARRMKDQMLEQRKKLAQMLEQVLTRDVLGALCGWDSELSALDMQVEGVEKSIGSVNKGLRGANSSAETAASGSKKKQNKKGEDACLDSGWVDDTSSQLLDLFEAMRANLDVVDVARHALEEACQRLSDGSCAEIINLMDSEGTLNDAEAEAEQIREENASVVERVSSNDIRQGLEFIEQVMSASQLPPGILPPNIEQLLAGNVDKLLALKKSLTAQASLMETLHADSVSIGRRVKTLQTGLKTHKALLSERILQGFTTALRPVSDAESRLMDALRKQRGLEDKARKDASDFLEEFSSAVKRAGPSTGGAEVSGPSVGAAKDSCMDAVKGAKDVRTSVATLRGGLGRVHKELAGKLSLVLDAIAGEPEPNSGKAREEAPEPSESKDKRKKKGKKGKPQAGGREDASPKNAPSVPEGIRSEPSHGESVKEAPSSQEASTKKGSSKPEKDEDAALRAEMAKEFAKDGKPEDSRKVVSGKDLLKELKSLKSQSDSLEERMAARLSRKAEKLTAEVAVEDGESEMKEAPQAPKAPVKKKKMYA